MKNAETIETVVTYCDVCGRNVRDGSTSYGEYGKDFCGVTYHNVLDRQVNCRELYTIRLQLKSADIDF